MALTHSFFAGMWALTALTACTNIQKAPAVGDVAPAFELPNQDGAPVRLADYAGKWVVLYFYPKDRTSGCTLEAHNFARDQAEYDKREAVILGVSVDDADSHKDFCTKESLHFKLLADTHRKVSEAYGSLMNVAVTSLSARHTFIIDPEGRIARAFLDVKPAIHSAEVLAALDDLEKR